MNRLQLVESLRFRLDELVASVWTDMELSHYLDQAIKWATRKQAQVDESYSNYEYQVPSVTLRQVTGGYHVFDTPYWMYRVTTLRESENSTTSGRNRIIPYRTLANATGYYWTWDRLNRIRLVNVGSINVSIECVKDAAPMLGGTVDTDIFAGPSGDTFYVRHDTAIPASVRVEKERNVFAGSMFEVTGVDTVSHPVSGQRRRIRDSEVRISNDGVVYSALTVDTPFEVPMNAGDTFEMMPEILPVHHEVVILYAAKIAVLKKANLQQQEVLKAQYAEEYESFVNSVTPRQTQEIPYIGMDRDDPYRIDQDTDRSRSW